MLVDSTDLLLLRACRLPRLRRYTTLVKGMANFETLVACIPCVGSYNSLCSVHMLWIIDDIVQHAYGALQVLILYKLRALGLKMAQQTRDSPYGCTSFRVPMKWHSTGYGRLE